MRYSNFSFSFCRAATWARACVGVVRMDWRDGNVIQLNDHTIIWLISAVPSMHTLIAENHKMDRRCWKRPSTPTQLL